MVGMKQFVILLNWMNQNGYEQLYRSLNNVCVIEMDEIEFKTYVARTLNVLIGAIDEITAELKVLKETLSKVSNSDDNKK